MLQTNCHGQLKGEFMNELNYASLEASKKLVDNGIVLETDYYWATYSESTLQSIRDAGKVYPRPYLVTKESIHEKHRTGHGYYPAPCFTDVWRELPDGILVNGSWAVLFITKHGNEFALVGYHIEHHVIISFARANPTDALIDLLIWLKGAGK